MVIGHFLASGNKVEEVSNLIGLWIKEKDVDGRKARMLLVIVMIRVYEKDLGKDQWKLRRMGVSL